jgi:hypothetical protein
LLEPEVGTALFFIQFVLFAIVVTKTLRAGDGGVTVVAKTGKGPYAFPFSGGVVDQSDAEFVFRGFGALIGKIRHYSGTPVKKARY